MAPPPFVRAVSYGVYQGRMREAIHALKYDRLHPASAGLGRMLAAAIAQLAGEAPAEMLVIPVPLHPSKYAQRGFNQSRSLAAARWHSCARAIRNGGSRSLRALCYGQRATESQAGLTPRQRRQNVRGAFLVSDPARVTAQHVLIVDDILTTGATARAAARALVAAGAASVWVATLARAQRVTGLGSTSVYEDMEEEEPLAGASAADSYAASCSTNGSILEKASF